MLLRMVSTQPPIDVIRIVSAGSIAWLSTSPTKGQDSSGVSPVL